MDKPLFVPLITKYYEEFENGTKTKEYRIYGPRHNSRLPPRSGSGGVDGT